MLFQTRPLAAILKGLVDRGICKALAAQTIRAAARPDQEETRSAANGIFMNPLNRPAMVRWLVWLVSNPEPFRACSDRPRFGNSSKELPRVDRIGLSH